MKKFIQKFNFILLLLICGINPILAGILLWIFAAFDLVDFEL